MIKPFKSIRTKLLLSFVFVILLTVAVIILVVFVMPMQAHMAERSKEGNTRDLMMTQTLVGELAKSSSVAKLQELAESYSILSNTFFSIFDMNGKLVVRSAMPGRKQMQNPPPQGAGKPENRDGEKPGMGGPMEFEISGLDFLSSDERQMIQNGITIQGIKTINTKDELFKMRYIVQPFKIADGTKLLLLTIHPAGPPQPSNEKVSYVLLQSFLIAGFVSIAAAIILSWLIVKPIKKMEDAAYNISRGDFSTKMNFSQNDELGALAAAFDSMTAELEKNINGRMKLMGDISHELNTPLAAIRVNTEAILDGVISNEEDRNKKLTAILNQTIRLSYLVDDLLELAKFETGEVHLIIDTFPVMETVTRAVETAEGIAQKKNDKILIYTENEFAKAMGDPRRISQVLINLVNNAIHHNPAGIEIKISITETTDKVVFSVEDNGVGIPKDELAEIFRRFHKVDRSRTRHDSGSGLGLAIVKEIIEAHNTNIKVESAMRKGTKFSFALNKVKE